MLKGRSAPFIGTHFSKLVIMLIEQTDNNRIVITFSSSVASSGQQRLINYIKYFEASSKSKAKQEDVDKLAEK